MKYLRAPDSTLLVGILVSTVLTVATWENLESKGSLCFLFFDGSGPVWQNQLRTMKAISTMQQLGKKKNVWN
jgi:hypothetical protein